jgi:hypothetical protein
MMEPWLVVAWAAVGTPVVVVLALVVQSAWRSVRSWWAGRCWFRGLMRIVGGIFDQFEARKPVRGQVVCNVRDLYYGEPLDTTWGEFKEALDLLINRGVIHLILVSPDGPTPKLGVPEHLKVPEKMPEIGNGYVARSYDLASAGENPILFLWDATVSNPWPFPFCHELEQEGMQ